MPKTSTMLARQYYFMILLWLLWFEFIWCDGEKLVMSAKSIKMSKDERNECVGCVSVDDNGSNNNNINKQPSVVNLMGKLKLNLQWTWCDWSTLAAATAAMQTMLWWNIDDGMNVWVCRMRADVCDCELTKFNDETCAFPDNNFFSFFGRFDSFRCERMEAREDDPSGPKRNEEIKSSLEFCLSATVWFYFHFKSVYDCLCHCVLLRAHTAFDVFRIYVFWSTCFTKRYRTIPSHTSPNRITIQISI